MNQAGEKVKGVVQQAAGSDFGTRVKAGVEKARTGFENILATPKQKMPVYLDYNASTPTHNKVADAMVPYLYHKFGNPGSGHAYGKSMKAAVDRARVQVAECLGCDPSEITFTSGGTESNNLAITGVVEGYYFQQQQQGQQGQQGQGHYYSGIAVPHVIMSAVEHEAVALVCKSLERRGLITLTIVPVDENGIVRVQDVKDAITDKTILITIMHSQNEIGTIQPIREIAQIANNRGVVMHTDCAQSVGKVAVNVEELGVSLLSLAGHKFYAPKGVGCLYIRRGVESKVERQLHGAKQERGLRPGTENVLEVVGLGEACELVAKHQLLWATHMRQRRNELWNALEHKDLIRLNGPADLDLLRLPNTLSLSYRGLTAQAIIDLCADHCVMSAGSACHSGVSTPSSVMCAMKVPLEYSLGTLRLSTGIYTTAEEVLEAARALNAAVAKLTAKDERSASVASEGGVASEGNAASTSVAQVATSETALDVKSETGTPATPTPSGNMGDSGDGEDV